MFTLPTRRNHDEALDKVTSDLLDQLNGLTISDDKYPLLLDQFVKIHAARTPKRSVNLDTLAVVLGNLAGIMVIVNHEHLNVVTSKALGFIGKSPQI